MVLVLLIFFIIIIFFLFRFLLTSNKCSSMDGFTCTNYNCKPIPFQSNRISFSSLAKTADRETKSWRVNKRAKMQCAIQLSASQVINNFFIKIDCLSFLYRNHSFVASAHLKTRSIARALACLLCHRKTEV